MPRAVSHMQQDKQSDDKDDIVDLAWRRWLVLGCMSACALTLLWRAVDLQIIDNEFLQREGRARYLRTVSVPAHRGKIMDRNGVVLAVSTPVDSVWVNPQEIDTNSAEWNALVQLLGLDAQRIRDVIASRRAREFVYLKRHLPPAQARRAQMVAPAGVYLQREYRRYYPGSDLTGHVVGFTDIDDRGQEGIELAFDQSLQGVTGSVQVLRDRKGHVVEAVRDIDATRAGKDLYLSIDRRLQYFAFRALASAVKRHKAHGGSVVVLDPVTGEVLAMVNQPAFNPNRRSDRVSSRFRNRAVTDVFEPGSTFKPFPVAGAMQSGRFDANSQIDTTPGIFKVSGHTVRDARNYGVIDLGTLIMKSSNVGATKIALAVEPQQMWQTLSRFGFGSRTASGFPGEVDGVLPHFFEWRDIHRATLSFGYGLSVTTLQLAHAYGAIANDGKLVPITMLRRSQVPLVDNIVSKAVARQMRQFLESVTDDAGTGRRARVPGYRVGGKTGTVRKSMAGGYSDDRYLSLFAGIAPISAPRLVIAVMIDEPRGEKYYGGEVAAPVFAEIASGSLRVLGIAPDAPNPLQASSATQHLARAAQTVRSAQRLQ
ncbi:MAG: cell division protein FtsI (penicillin-binding protein 3) [Gammaproteobacteria bacterium]|jgi:cell division protein FtsI (penicillin-binding protein 3)